MTANTELEIDGNRALSTSCTEASAAPKTLSYYRRELTPYLQPGIYAPNPMRLVWYVACVLGSLGSFFAVVYWAPSWPLKLVLGLVIGLCNGTLGFISHELFHGSITKNQLMQNVFGFIGSTPYLMAPTYWRFSHNRLHHGKTQQLIRDPDAFPNVRIFKSSKFMKFMFPFTPGSGHKRSVMYFFFWFSVHNLVAQVNLRFKNKVYDAMDHRRVNLEFGGQLLIVAALMWIAGPSNWLWLFVIPLAVQNYLLMSYISTNHNLCPLNDDPLVNSLSVTNHPVLEYLNMNFGYHVEHHLYPTVNGKHMKLIHQALVSRFPDQYKIMPKWQAMRALYKTARIYKSQSELINPETMESYSTI
jgi:fatty acid desaturase